MGGKGGRGWGERRRCPRRVMRGPPDWSLPVATALGGGTSRTRRRRRRAGWAACAACAARAGCPPDGRVGAAGRADRDAP